MPVIDSFIINRFFDQGEQELSVEHPFLVDRISIPLVSGQNIYQLPDWCLEIRRATFQGIGLDPLPLRNQRQVFQNSTQQGTPFWYVFDNVGLRNIKLFPAPNVNIAAAPAGTDLFSQAAIAQYFIVEFNRVSDNNLFIVPPALRRQLLKKYVAYNCFIVDGSGVSLKMSQWMKQRWEVSKADFFEILDLLYSQPRNLVINDFNTFNFFPGSPVLPINRFGISVAEGE